MPTFKKLVVLDKIDTSADSIEQLKDYGEEVEVHSDFPSEEEVHKRLQNTDAVMLSWKTPLTAEHIKRADHLKYIGLAASFYGNDSSNVDAVAAKEKDICIKGIFDYGDPGVIEFILSECIRLLNGYGEHQWKENIEELAGQKFGIIGLGTTGQLLAKALIALGVEVFYYSRTRKPEQEKKGIDYLPLEKLVKQCNLVSVHLPKNTKIFTPDIFKAFGNEKILINTSLGLPFNEDDFLAWIKENGNFAIFDGDGSAELKGNSRHLDGIIIRDQSAGWSIRTKQRRGEKILQNIKSFLEKKDRKTC